MSAVSRRAGRASSTSIVLSIPHPATVAWNQQSSWQIYDSRSAGQHRSAATKHPDIVGSDLRAKRIPVDAEQRRGLDLIAARGGQSGANERRLDGLENAVIEPC